MFKQQAKIIVIGISAPALLAKCLTLTNWQFFQSHSLVDSCSDMWCSSASGDPNSSPFPILFTSPIASCLLHLSKKWKNEMKKYKILFKNCNTGIMCKSHK